MKTAFALCFGTLLAMIGTGALAQGDKPAAAPKAGATAAAMPAKTEAPKVVAAPPAARAPRRHSRANEDARACLDAGNNTAIVRCAEKYL